MAKPHHGTISTLSNGTLGTNTNDTKTDAALSASKVGIAAVAKRLALVASVTDRYE
ncbi:hypothetical protein E4U54_003752, partial [Claviceps lovelessii]